MKNVTISGGQLIGEKNGHVGTSGEWGFGIDVEDGSSNIMISNVTISGCWGDGIYLGGSTPVTNVTIQNVVCDNNRRQGISITNAAAVTIMDCVLKNTSGTAPSDGLDVEPNQGNSVIGLTISNVSCFGNQGDGIQMTGYNGPVSNVTMSNVIVHNNMGSGLKLDGVSNVDSSGLNTYSNNEFGIFIFRDASTIKFTATSAYENKKNGVTIYSDDPSRAVKDVTFYKLNTYNNGQMTPGEYDGVMIVSDVTGVISGISFINCSFYDNQAAPTQSLGLYVQTDRNISNISLTTCSFSGGIYGSYNENTAIQM